MITYTKKSLREECRRILVDNVGLTVEYMMANFNSNHILVFQAAACAFAFSYTSPIIQQAIQALQNFGDFQYEQ